MTEKETKPVEDETPPPPPPKPKRRGGGNSGILGYSTGILVAVVAVVVAAFVSGVKTEFETYDPPITWEDHMDVIYSRYFTGPPRLQTLQDLASVKNLTSSQKDRLNSFRAKYLKQPLYNPKPNENVVKVTFQLPRSANRTDVPANTSIAIDIFKPLSNVVEEKLTNIQTLPTLVYFHGGNFVAGSQHDAWAQDIAAAVPCLVVSVQYGLAPEYRYETAVMDGVDAMFWAMDHYTDLQVDDDRFGLAGTEAGATIAAAVAFNLRDRGFKHSVRVLGLAAPFLVRPSANLPSYTGQRQDWEDDDLAWDLYTGHTTEEDKKQCRKNTNCSPYHGRKLHDLPPLLVYLPEYDSRRAGGINFYNKLLEAGEFVRHMTSNTTRTGAINRLDEEDAGFTQFTALLKDGFFPPESPLEMAMKKVREYAEAYG